MPSNEETLFNKYKDRSFFNTQQNSRDAFDSLLKIHETYATAESGFFLALIYDSPQQIDIEEEKYYPARDPIKAIACMLGSAKKGYPGADGALNKLLNQSFHDYDLAVSLFKYFMDYRKDFTKSLHFLEAALGEKEAFTSFERINSLFYDALQYINNIDNQNKMAANSYYLQMINLFISKASQSPANLNNVKFTFLINLIPHIFNSKYTIDGGEVIAKLCTSLGIKPNPNDISDNLISFYFLALKNSDPNHKNVAVNIANSILMLAKKYFSGEDGTKIDAQKGLEKIQLLMKTDYLPAKIFYVNLIIKGYQGSKFNADELLDICEEIIKNAKNLQQADVVTLVDSIKFLKNYQQEGITLAANENNRMRAHFLFAKLGIFTYLDKTNFPIFDQIPISTVTEDFKSAIEIADQQFSNLAEAHYYLGMISFKGLNNNNFPDYESAINEFELYIIENQFKPKDEAITNDILKMCEFTKTIPNLSQQSLQKIDNIQAIWNAENYINNKLHAEKLLENKSQLPIVLHTIHVHLEKILTTNSSEYPNELGKLEKLISAGSSDAWRIKAHLEITEYRLHHDNLLLLSAIKSLKSAIQLHEKEHTHLDYSDLISMLPVISHLSDQIEEEKTVAEDFLAELNFQFAELCRISNSPQLNAFDYYQKAVNHGHGPALYYLAETYLNPVTIEYEEAENSTFEKKPLPFDYENSLRMYKRFFDQVAKNNTTNYYLLICQALIQLQTILDQYSRESAKEIFYFGEQLSYWQALLFDPNWSPKELERIDQADDRYRNIFGYIYENIDSLINNKKIEQATEYLDRMLSDPHIHIVNAYIKRAEIFVIKNDFLKAIADLKLAVNSRAGYLHETTNQLSPTYSLILEKNSILKNFSESLFMYVLTQIEQSAVNQSNKAEIYFRLAELYAECHKNEHIFSKDQVASHEAYQNLSAIKKSTFDISYCIQYYAKAFFEDKTNLTYAFALSDLYLTNNDHTNAIQTLVDAGLELLNKLKTSDKIADLNNDLNKIIDKLAGINPAAYSAAINLEREKTLYLYTQNKNILQNWTSQTKGPRYADYVIDHLLANGKIDEAMTAMSMMANKGHLKFALNYAMKACELKKFDLLDKNAFAYLQMGKFTNEDEKDIKQTLFVIYRSIYDYNSSNRDEKIKLYKSLIDLYHYFNRKEDTMAIYAILDALANLHFDDNKHYSTLINQFDRNQSKFLATVTFDPVLLNKIHLKQEVNTYYNLSDRHYRDAETNPDKETSEEPAIRRLITLADSEKNPFANYCYGKLMRSHAKARSILNADKKIADQFELAVLGGESIALNDLFSCHKNNLATVIPILFEAILANPRIKIFREKLAEVLQASKTLNTAKLSSDSEKDLYMAIATNNQKNLQILFQKDQKFYKKIVNFLVELQKTYGKDRDLFKLLNAWIDNAVSGREQQIGILAQKQTNTEELQADEPMNLPPASAPASATASTQIPESTPQVQDYSLYNLFTVSQFQDPAKNINPPSKENVPAKDIQHSVEEEKSKTAKAQFFEKKIAEPTSSTPSPFNRETQGENKTPYKSKNKENIKERLAKEKYKRGSW